MPKEIVDRLEQVHERFAPADGITQRAWLFSNSPKLLNPPTDWRMRHVVVEDARLGAVRELSNLGGLPALLEFSAAVEQPGAVGFTLGKSQLLEDEEDSFLKVTLSAPSDAQNLFVRGFVSGRFITRSWDWVSSKLASANATAWSSEQRGDFLACLSFEARTWDLLESFDTETQRVYWSRVNPYGLPSRVDSERAAVKLIKHGRPHVAIDFIALHNDDEGPAVPHSVIAEALEQLLEVARETQLEWSSFGYDITRLLNTLAESSEIDESRVATLEWAYCH